MPRRDCGVSAMLEMMQPAFVRHPNRKIGESVAEIEGRQETDFTNKTDAGGPDIAFRQYDRWSIETIIIAREGSWISIPGRY